MSRIDVICIKTNYEPRANKIEDTNKSKCNE